MKKMLSLAALLAAAALLTACTTQESLSGSAYSRSSARQGQTVRFGVIESIEDVLIEGTGGQMSSIGGAVLGTAIGSTIGGGSGTTVAMAAGGVGGAVAGSAIGHKLSQRKGISITVQYQNGDVGAVEHLAGAADAERAQRGVVVHAGQVVVDQRIGVDHFDRAGVVQRVRHAAAQQFDRRQ